MTNTKTLDTPPQAEPDESSSPAIPNGNPDGPALDGPTQPEAGSQAEPVNAVPTAASEPEPPASALHAHLTGEPDSLPEVWCPKCQANVKPKGRGQCPRCGRVLKLSFLARRHPVNVLRREALLADLLEQFPPTNILERSTCEHLAGTLEQLETMKPGSPDWQRLVQTAQTLSSSLGDARLARAVRPTDDYENFTDDQCIERIEALLKYAHETRDLRHHIERVAAAEKAQPVVSSPDSAGAALPTQTTTRTAAPAPAPDPAPCKWCNRSPCIGVEHPAFYTLHPEAAQARDDERLNKEFRLAVGIDRWPR